MSAIDAGWAIRLFEANNYGKEGTFAILSNFRTGTSRQEDNITVFTGEYGIDQYLIWEMHGNLPFYDFSTTSIDLELYLNKNTNMRFFKEFYRVVDVMYDYNKSKFTIYAISEANARLETKLADYEISSVKWEEEAVKITKYTYYSYTRDPTTSAIVVTEEKPIPEPLRILTEVLQSNGIFGVIFHEDNESLTGKEIHHEYKSLDLDALITVRDFIEYVAEENNYEWLVTKEVSKNTNIPTFYLHIGHQIHPSIDRNATKELNRETDFNTKGTFTKKITTVSSPMDVLAHWNEEMRCVWAKHTAGAHGANSIGCFVPIGWGHFPKELFVRSLEGEREINLGFGLLFKRRMRFPSLIIGNTLQDDGNNQIDVISVQKQIDNYAVKTPKDIIFDRGTLDGVVRQKEKVDRVSPYIEDSAGIFFPSPDTTTKTPANSVIGNVEGRNESHVHLGYVPGNGSIGFIVPIKNAKDFRWQFPNGWVMYVKENGDTYLQIDGANPSFIPTYDSKKVFLQLKTDGTIKINKDATTAIEIDSSGNITIKSTGTIDIGALASAINLAGGAKALAHALHTHTLTAVHTHNVIAIGSPTGPPLGQDSANACTDNTIKTKAD